MLYALYGVLTLLVGNLVYRQDPDLVGQNMGPRLLRDSCQTLAVCAQTDHRADHRVGAFRFLLLSLTPMSGPDTRAGIR